MAAKNKIKIICTIGPVSRTPEILSHLMLAGMNVARLNFSHGNFTSHKEDVLQIRQVAQKVGKSVAIMADLPGPKIRIGELVDEPAAVVVPTHSGTTARNITRYRLPVWVLAVSSQKKTCQELIFSYGIIPIHEPDHPNPWRQWIRTSLQLEGIEGDWVILTEGPSEKYPDRNDRMEIIDLTRN